MTPIYSLLDFGFKVGDRAVLSRSADARTAYPPSLISQITSSTSFIMKEQGEIDVTRYLEDNPYIIERKIAKVNALNFPEASVYSSDVQNVYKERAEDKLLITSPENIAWILNIRGQDSKFSPVPNCHAILDYKKKNNTYC